MDLIVENSLRMNTKQASETSGIEKGIGLENTKKMLELLYEGNYNLNISQKDTYFIHLNMNLHE